MEKDSKPKAAPKAKQYKRQFVWNKKGDASAGGTVKMVEIK